MKNTLKLKNTGSLNNLMMGNNETEPIVGQGATQMLWTDRYAFEVLEVSKDKKTCVIQQYEAERADKNGMSEDQSYKYEKLIYSPITIVYKWGAWRTKTVSVTFADELLEKHGEYAGRQLHEAYKLSGGQYDKQAQMIDVISGVTRKHTNYNKINIIFGIKRQYYDYSF